MTTQTKPVAEHVRQARNIANAAYIANQRLGMTPKQAREASKVFVAKPVYRSEKIGRLWYAMRRDERASEGFTTKREAESAATKRMCSDLVYTRLGAV